MRWMRVLLLSAMVASASAIVARSADPVGPVDPKIEGWGPFKFGMTMAAVRGLKDYRAALSSTHSVSAFGSLYDLSLQFRWGLRRFPRDRGLSSVQFYHIADAPQDHTSCERAFRAAVLGVERHYGSLTTKLVPRRETGPAPGQSVETSVFRVGNSTYAREASVGWRSAAPPGADLRFTAERSSEGTVSILGRSTWDLDNAYGKGKGKGKGGWSLDCHIQISVDGKSPANIRD